MEMKYNNIRIQQSEFSATVWMNRPEVRNAMNGMMIGEMCAALESLSADNDLKTIVIRGEGGTFSSGADLKWMRESATGPEEENRSGSGLISQLMEALVKVPVPLVSVAEGAVFGGAIGILACSDMVLVSADTRFGFSEVRLGLAPAVIMPYVMRRTAAPAIKVLMLNGRQFTAQEAAACGLADTVTEPVRLNDAAAEIVSTLEGLPGSALREIKHLWNLSMPAVPENIRIATIDSLTRLKKNLNSE